MSSQTDARSAAQSASSAAQSAQAAQTAAAQIQALAAQTNSKQPSITSVTEIYTTSGGATIAPYTVISVYIFTGALVGDLSIVLTTAGVPLGAICTVVTPGLLNGHALSVNGLPLLSKQSINFAFDGAVWNQTGMGNLL